jgi:hypothetical protein
MDAKWEYNIVIFAMDSMVRKQKHLTELGNEGWELVAIVEDTFYFKRYKTHVIGEATMERKYDWRGQ